MSYATHSLGLTAQKVGIAPTARLTGTPSVTPMVDVGVDPSLVRAFATYFAHLRDTVGASDRPRIGLTLAYINALRPNQFGRFDPAKVSQAFRTLPDTWRTFVDTAISPGSGRSARTPAAAALNNYTVTKLLADIDGGRFAGRPAQATVTFTSFGTKTSLPGGGVLTRPNTNVATKEPEPPPVRADVKEVVCTDGYVRDAAGLCVPGAAPPVPTTKPATVEEPKKDERPVVVSEEKKDELFVDDQYAPPGPGPMIDTQVLPPPSEVLPPGKGPLGIAWRWWGLGAASLAAVGLMLGRSNNKSVTPNRSRRATRNRR